MELGSASPSLAKAPLIARCLGATVVMLTSDIHTGVAEEGAPFVNARDELVQVIKALDAGAVERLLAEAHRLRSAAPG